MDCASLRGARESRCVTIRRQAILSIVIVGLALPFGLCAAAALAQVQLLAGASSGALIVLSMPLFFAVPLIIASGFPAAFALYRSGVHIAAAYAANTIASAALASYAYLYNFSVAENLGSILWRLPRNGRDDSDGMITAPPPFLGTLADTFGSVGHFVTRYGNDLAGMAVLALLAGLPCGWNFWRRAVRKFA